MKAGFRNTPRRTRAATLASPSEKPDALHKALQFIPCALQWMGAAALLGWHESATRVACRTEFDGALPWASVWRPGPSPTFR